MGRIPGPERLAPIYDTFERESAPLREAAVCTAGCAFCCRAMGRVDITTLEGLVIRRHLAGLPKKTRAGLEKGLVRDRKVRAAGRSGPCPFLRKNDTCAIYPVRPFSCRQLYSLKTCGEQGPTVHRQVVEMARKTVRALQRADENGYSGHISHILEMLAHAAFRTLYMEGGFDPAAVQVYGKAHGILINRAAAEQSGGRPGGEGA